MDTDTLVDNLIADGQKLIAELPRRGFAVTAAFWLQASEDGNWYFYIVSPAVDSDGLAKAYRRLHPLVRAMPQPFWIDPLEIRLVGPSSGIAQDVLAIHSATRVTWGSAIRWSGKKSGNVGVESVYLYPLPSSTP
ncbi:MAG: hypothetical protein HYS13_18785 [Planctomycetia bacterium]|nr:hypothetical protein [Planctomycetia bacterium]